SDSFSLESGEYSQRNQKTNIWFDLLRSLTIQTVLCSSEIPGLMGDSSENSKRVKLSDGRFLAYRESGVPKEEAKYKIILVHGFGSSKDMNFSASKKPDLDFVSQELIQELGVYLLFYDRSGYGKSDSNAKRSLKSEVNDIVELADQLEIGPKFYLIGLSMGSYPTWGCLKHIPRRLSGVAFVAPVVNYLWPSLPNELIKEDYMGGLIEWGLRISKFAPRLLHWLVILIQKVLPSTSSVLESKQVYFNSHDMEVLKRTTGFPMFTKEKLRERDVFDTLRDDFVACFGQWDFEPEDLSITQESNVHIWHGKEDKVVPFQLQRCVLQKQPLINYHEIPQGGHLIVHYDGTCDAVLRALLLAGLIFHKRMEIFLDIAKRQKFKLLEESTSWILYLNGTRSIKDEDGTSIKRKKKKKPLPLFFFYLLLRPSLLTKRMFSLQFLIDFVVGLKVRLKVLWLKSVRFRFFSE
ncbi:unnamed protein product, partial [Brassica napus]